MLCAVVRGRGIVYHGSVAMTEPTLDKKPAAGDKAAPTNARESPSSTGGTHDLVEGLVGPLREMCKGRLGPVQWFRSTWQRGGAATGYSTWTFSDKTQVDVLVKLPVGPREYGWTVGLGHLDNRLWHTPEAVSLPVPRVIAAGEMIGGYDLAWFVVERLSGPALNQAISEPVVREILHAAAEFHAAAAALKPVEGAGEQRDWHELIARSRELLEFTTMPETKRWAKCLSQLARALPRVLEVWKSRPLETWCHGDLHPGNAMRRELGPDEPGRCVLFDLAFVHPGHWVEDAVYVERQFWAHPEVLGKTKPIQELRRQRRALGLESSGDYTELAAARRVMMAGCASAWWESEGTPAYARGALRVLEKHLGLFV
ncbi:MAG: phosphotransferase [Planctomycetota bacterium]|nr:phosphotransferase [Planctomycetota bacterium]